MKYGQNAGSKAINRKMIDNCYQHLSDSDVGKFVRKFKEQSNEKVQIIHTFHELILGAFLAQNGFSVYHDYEIESKTPDWCVLDIEAQPHSIFELTNFHPAIKTSNDIASQIQEMGIWANFVTPNTERLYHAITEKATKYKSIVENNNLKYIVSVFGDFFADVKQNEIDECLFNNKSGLFNQYPEISGLLYFEETLGSYQFIYKPNPFAERIMKIPDGLFPGNNKNE